MITELYAIDRQLVDNLIENIVTIELQTFSGGTLVSTEVLPAENIISESLEIKQSICDSEELRIGGCIPSQLTLNVMNTGDLSGKRIVVKIRTRYYTDVLFPSGSLYPSTTLYPNAATEPVEMSTSDYILFVGPIYSCTKTSNHKIRKLIAFDRMYYASTVLCKNRIRKWLASYDERTFNFGMFINSLRPKARIDIGASAFINWGTDYNITSSVWGEIIDNGITYLDVFKYFCEINGVFLIEDTPDDITSIRAKARAISPYLDIDQRYEISSYSGLTYEDFLSVQIRYAQFFYKNGETFVYIHEDPYEGFSTYISDNPLMQCIRMGSHALPIIGNLAAADATDHKDKITGDAYVYRPFKASVFNRWWVQVGDRVKLPTNDPDVPYVESIVFSRTLKGLYGMRVEIEAKGVEIMGKENDESL